MALDPMISPWGGRPKTTRSHTSGKKNFHGDPGARGSEVVRCQTRCRDVIDVALMEESDDARGGMRQVGHDETEVQIVPFGMPLDRGHDPAGLVSGLWLVPVVGTKMK